MVGEAATQLDTLSWRDRKIDAFVEQRVPQSLDQVEALPGFERERLVGDGHRDKYGSLLQAGGINETSEVAGCAAPGLHHGRLTAEQCPLPPVAGEILA